MTSNECPHRAAADSSTPSRGQAELPLGASVEELPRPSWRFPFLGDLLRLNPKAPTQNELKLARQLGPIYDLKIGPTTSVTVLTGTNVVAEANDEARFEKFVAPPHIKMRDIAGDGLFTAFNREPNWAIAHEILQPGFTKAAMQQYHTAMSASVNDLFANWDSQAEGTLHDIAADMNALTFEVIGRAGFSQSFGAFDARRRQFIERLNRAMFWMSTSVNAFPLARAVLALRHGRQYERDVAWLNDYAAEIVEARQADPQSEMQDLLNLMLNAQSARGEALPPENVANQVITFLLAGNETTAGAMGFAMHYMANHPDIATAVRQEVDAVAPDGRDITFTDVAKLRLTRRVIDETLRLWPPAPAYFRRARMDQVIGGKYLVRKGSPVMVLVLGLHRTDEWGSNPDEFDPSRFDRMTSRGPAYPYRPFGTGPRACIGRQFALHEMVLALAMILRRYTPAPEPGYALEVAEQLTLKPRNLRIRLTPRARAI